MESAYFDADAVATAVGFIETLTLTKSTRSMGPEPFELLPHSKKLIANLWGWKRADGTRQFRKALFTLGRKQGKTQTAAALVICEFFLNPEPKQEIYMAATDVTQASICFEAIYDLIVGSVDLLDMCEVTLSKRLIRHKQTGSIIRVLSGEGRGKHGYNPSMVIFDELHEWGPAQAELYVALTTGGKSRRQPLRLIITTAGSDQETICYREYDYAKRILAGEVVDDNYFPLIYEVPPEADWTNQELWPLSLPLLETGHHSIADYQNEFDEAMARPSEQNKFRRMYLNQWTSTETQWIPMHNWDACENKEFPDLAGVPCFGGLDLGRSQDLTAFSLCWVLGDTHYTRTWFWIPAGGIEEKSKREGVSYALWAREGYITLTPGDVTDFRMVEAQIKALCEQYEVNMLAYDPAFAQEIAQNLTEGGINVVKFKQSPLNFTEPCSKIERLIYGKNFVHDGNPVLRWNFDCAKIVVSATGLCKLVKPNRLTSRKHIDGAVSTTMAVGIAIEPMLTSIWETRGAPN